MFQGTHQHLNKRVAIKVLHTHLVRQPALVERFRQEALIQARLSHPNIVSVNDFFLENDVCGIVMEYIEGETFDDLLARNGGPLDVGRVVQLFLPLLNALQVAHSNKIIHRDLKPSNLILQNLQGAQIPKIMDFGIARALDESKRLTATGTKMGTQEYMSPEQCEGKSEITHLSDIYSMAVSMYEMLTGRVPFSCDSDYQLMKAIITEPPPPIRQINPKVPPWLENVLLTAMHKDPSQRYASAGQFADSITQQLRTPRSPTPPPTDPPAQAPFPQKGETIVDPSLNDLKNQKSKGLSKNTAFLIFGIAFLAVILFLGAMWISKEKHSDSPPISLPAVVVKHTPAPTPKPNKSAPSNLTSDPASAKYEAKIAGGCFKRRDFSCALIHYKKASQHEPNSGRHFDDVAYTYMKMGEWASCLSWAKRAYHLADTSQIRGTSQRNAGYCLAKLGNYSEACNYYRGSLLDRSNSTTRNECNEICSDCP